MVSAQRPFHPKVVPPRRRGDIVRRRRLHEVLGDALEHDVVVLTAPAGYGKSTLAVDWLDEADIPLAWLSLDRQDRDPLSLIGDLVTALRFRFPETLIEFSDRIEAGATPEAAVALVNELSAAVHLEIDEMFALVIDDLHMIDDAPDALDVIDTLTTAVPLPMRLYVLSRTMPRLGSLGRMTAQRRALTIGTRDLIFTDDEAGLFLTRQGVMDAAARDQLIERSDGWAAALAILADQYQRLGFVPQRGDAEAQFLLSQFIQREVIDRLDADSINLLTACCVVDSFDFEIARQLSEDQQAASVLRDLEQSTHFLARLGEEDGEWYRMHALLREHLLAKLEVEEPDRLLQLRRRAAALFASRGDRALAVELSLEAADWNEVVREVHESRERLYQRGEWSRLAGWIDRLPETVLDSEPDLALTRARLAIKFASGQEGLERLKRLDDQSLNETQRVRHELYRAVAMRQVTRLDDAIEACRRARSIALESLDDGDPLFAEIDLEEGIALGQSGRFTDARSRLESAAAAFDASEDQHRAAETHDALGSTLFNLGGLTDATAEFAAAQRRWRTLAEPGARVSTMNNMGNVQHMLGELDLAHDMFDAVIEQAERIQQRRTRAYGQEGLAAVERDLGRIDRSVALFNVAIQEAQELDDPVLIMSATYGLAMCYRERGDYPQARSLLEHGLRLADQGGAELQRARFRSGLGATLIGERRHREAIPVLELAVEEAEATGARREEALSRLRLAIACYHARARRLTLEQLTAVASIVGRLGYDQFLVAEARQDIEVIEYGAQRRAGGDYYPTLAARLQPGTAVVEDGAARGGAPAIRAEAFGLPRVLLDGRTVDDGAWGSERSKEMFFYLLHRGERLRKEDIALDLWPDADRQRLNSVFHSTLHRLRRAIHRQVVVQEDGVYQVNPEFEIEYDANEFERLERTAAGADEGSEEWRDALARALGLYRGPFGAGFESDWAEQARRRYEETYLLTMLALASAALRREDASEAIRLAESVLEMDATNEEATGYLVRAHALGGHVDLAMRAYGRLQRAWREELGAEPSERIRAIYREVISAGTESAD
jgi:LuxR family maltose regulon positive regulatory protein